jgi:hypothetical protein
MTNKVEELKTLNIDGEQYNIADMSEAVQRMVGIFNGWNQREVEAHDELMMVQAAKADLSRQIILQVRKEKDEAAEDSAEPAVDSEETTDEE